MAFVLSRKTTPQRGGEQAIADPRPEGTNVLGVWRKQVAIEALGTAAEGACDDNIARGRTCIVLDADLCGRCCGQVCVSATYLEVPALLMGCLPDWRRQCMITCPHTSWTVRSMCLNLQAYLHTCNVSNLSPRYVHYIRPKSARTI